MIKEFSFGLPQNILFGEGSINKLSEILINLKVSKIIIISGPHLTKMGVTDQVVSCLSETMIEAVSFSEIEANPSVETVNAAAQICKNEKVEAIVAIGGGSPIDVAKAAGIMATYGGDIKEYEGVGKVPGKIMPLIVIPTTAGTGSEVTSFSVITDRSRNYKLTVGSEYLLPQNVILDPEFLRTTPKGVAAASGMDAMVHAIEAYINKVSNPFIEMMAEKAMELIGGSIRKFTADRSDMEAAGNMLLGSCFAGIAFNFGRLGNVHAMAHPVGGYFNVAHGVANAILLPTCLKFNAIADQGKYRKIYDYISYNKGKDDFEPLDLVEEIIKLSKSLDIPQSLKEVGVEEGYIEKMASDAMKSGNVLVNPRTTTQKDIELLYKEAL